jgi:hypothetical protein
VREALYKVELCRLVNPDWELPDSADRVLFGNTTFELRPYRDDMSALIVLKQWLMLRTTGNTGM